MVQLLHLIWLYAALGKNLEQLLNLVWLCVALCIIGGWAWQKARSPGGQLHSARLQVVALICLVVFLFFPISISDDLHLTGLAAEVSDASRKTLNKIMLRAPVAANQVYGAAVMLAQAQVLASFRATFCRQSQVTSAEGFAAPISPRGPPYLS